MVGDIIKNKFVYKFKDVRFTEKNIILCGENIIDFVDIKYMSYTSKNILNYLLIWGISCPPGYLLIELDNLNLKRKRYLIKISYKELMSIPRKYLVKANIVFM